MKENYLSWDDSSQYVKTGVAGLKFLTVNGTEIKVADLTEDITLELPSHLPPVTQGVHIHVDKVEKRQTDLVIHNISCRSVSPTTMKARLLTQQTQNICITFRRRWTDVGYILCKCLCLLGRPDSTKMVH